MGLLIAAAAFWGTTFFRCFLVNTPNWAPDRGMIVDVHSGIMRIWAGFVFDGPGPYDQWHFSSGPGYWRSDELKDVLVPSIIPPRPHIMVLDGWDVYIPLWLPVAVAGLLTWWVWRKTRSKSLRGAFEVLTKR